MTTPLLSRQPLLITLGAVLSLLPVTTVQGQAAPEGPVGVPSMPYDLSVFAGFYAPLGSLFVPGNCGGSPCTYGGDYGGAPTVGLQKMIAVGGHLTMWLAKRTGIEATFAYAPSGVTMGCRVPDCNAGHAVTASAKVVVPVRSVITSPGSSFFLGAGVGLVALGGNAYLGVDGTTSISPTVGAGLQLKLASTHAVRIEADGYLLRPPFHGNSYGCDASWGLCRVVNTSGWTQQSQPVVMLSIGWVFRGGGPRH